MQRSLLCNTTLYQGKLLNFWRYKLRWKSNNILERILDKLLKTRKRTLNDTKRCSIRVKVVCQKIKDIQTEVHSISWKMTDTHVLIILLRMHHNMNVRSRDNVKVTWLDTMNRSSNNKIRHSRLTTGILQMQTAHASRQVCRK